MDQEYLNILAPVQKTRFLEDYWERSPLHVERSKSEYFKALLSIEDIEALLTTGGQVFPDVQLVNASVDIPVSEYTDQDRRVIAPGLWRHHREGATVVISGAERRFVRLADLCRTVSCELCMRSQANLYLSPGSHQGFKPHYDTHDVFVLQVSGSKLFRFYQSDVELPFSEETFPSDYAINPAVQETVLLTAGDTLYIPRGVVHDAVAQERTSSLHITLGVYPLVVRDVLQEMVQILAEREVGLRRTVDLQSSIGNEEWQNILPSFSFTDDMTLFEEARTRLIDEVAVGITPSSRHQLDAVSSIANPATVAIDDAAIISVDYFESRLKLRVPGQVIEFAEPYASAIQRLLENNAMSLEDLDNLDDKQRLALLDQLQKVNCIRMKLDS